MFNLPRFARIVMFCGICSLRDGDFVLGLMVCALVELFYGCGKCDSFVSRMVRVLLAISCRELQGPEPAGDRLRVTFFRFVEVI